MSDTTPPPSIIPTEAQAIANKIRNGLDAARKAMDEAYSFEEGLQSNIFIRSVAKFPGVSPIAAAVRCLFVVADSLVDAVDAVADTIDPSGAKPVAGADELAPGGATVTAPTPVA